MAQCLGLSAFSAVARVQSQVGELRFLQARWGWWWWGGGSHLGNECQSQNLNPGGDSRIELMTNMLHEVSAPLSPHQLTFSVLP